MITCIFETYQQHPLLVGLEHEIEILRDHLATHVEGLNEVARVLLLIWSDEGEGDSLLTRATRSSEREEEGLI